MSLSFSPQSTLFFSLPQSKTEPFAQGEYNVYSTFQSHEPEFDYLKSLEIEEKINKIRWLPQQNAAHFLLSTNGEGSRVHAHTHTRKTLCWTRFRYDYTFTISSVYFKARLKY